MIVGTKATDIDKSSVQSAADGLASEGRKIGFLPELSESGYEFRAETLLEQHLHILLKAPFGQMPDVLKYLRADVRGRHDKEPAQIIGFVIAERDSRSIELLKQDSENRGM